MNAPHRPETVSETLRRRIGRDPALERETAALIERLKANPNGAAMTRFPTWRQDRERGAYQR